MTTCTIQFSKAWNVPKPPVEKQDMVVGIRVGNTGRILKATEVLEDCLEPGYEKHVPQNPYLD